MAAPLGSRVASPLAAAAVLVVSALLASGCGSSSTGSVSAAATSPHGGESAAASGGPVDPDPSASGSADPGASPASPGPGARGTAEPATYSRVLLAGGVRQWIHCAGSGPVTVVVIAGIGSSHDDWSEALPSLEGVTRTCVSDRPGLGSSPPRSSPNQVVDAGLHARELHALLTAAGERGPYVVVGHSYGGLVARAFVHLFTGEVRGLLLLESVTPGDLTRGAFWTEAGHRVDLVASGRADAGGPPLGRLPLVVLSASNPDGNHLDGPPSGRPEGFLELWQSQQAADVRLSTDAIHVVAQSGHLVQQDDPAAVVEATRELVLAASGGGALACLPVWTGLAATCG